jgi:hypothetical protein
MSTSDSTGPNQGKEIYHADSDTLTTWRNW